MSSLLTFLARMCEDEDFCLPTPGPGTAEENSAWHVVALKMFVDRLMNDCRPVHECLYYYKIVLN